jgi:hypothetical protein
MINTEPKRTASSVVWLATRMFRERARRLPGAFVFDGKPIRENAVNPEVFD